MLTCYVLTIISQQVASESNHDPNDTHYLTVHQLVSTDTVDTHHGLEQPRSLPTHKVADRTICPCHIGLPAVVW